VPDRIADALDARAGIIAAADRKGGHRREVLPLRSANSRSRGSLRPMVYTYAYIIGFAATRSL
jgi:hypothetical protein